MKERPVAELIQEKKISQVINKRLVQGSPDLSLRTAMDVMQDNRSGYMVLSKNKKVVGIFTEVDVIQRVIGCNADWEKPVSEFMTPNPFVLNPKDSVGKAIQLMGEKSFYHIPLVDENNELIGMLSARTLIRFLAEFYPTEVYNLPPVPNQIMETPEGG